MRRTEAMQARTDAAAPDRPQRIETLTAVYDPLEDRIRLNMRTEDGARCAMLLTRRLLERLVPAVIERMEQTAPQGRMREVALSMAQQQARRTRAEAPAPQPVEPPDDAQPALCVSVRLNSAPRGLMMTFRDASGRELALPDREGGEHALLDILSTLCARAGWSAEVFPDWMGPEPDDARPTGAQRLN